MFAFTWMSAFGRLNLREKRAIAMLALVLCGLLGYEGIWAPLTTWHQRLRTAAAVKQTRLQQLTSLTDTSKALQERLSSVRQQIEARPGDFDLFSFLRQVSDSLHIGNHITTMKPLPSETKGAYRLTRMEMKWKDVEFDTLRRWLAQVETAEYLVHISKLTITPSPENPTLLEASLQVQALER